MERPPARWREDVLGVSGLLRWARRGDGMKICGTSGRTEWNVFFREQLQSHVPEYAETDVHAATPDCNGCSTKLCQQTKRPPASRWEGALRVSMPPAHCPPNRRPRRHLCRLRGNLRGGWLACAAARHHRTKLVITIWFSGAGMPLVRPSAMHLSSQAMLRPMLVIVIRPSLSCCTSSGCRPYTWFQ